MTAIATGRFVKSLDRDFAAAAKLRYVWVARRRTGSDTNDNDDLFKMDS
jgi:hypothetical protein